MPPTAVKDEMWLGVVQPGYQVAEGEEDAYFSKIGGDPKWVWGRPLPVRCGAGCGQPLPLVAQLYVPLDVFDRVLYVFACRNEACQLDSRSWACLRAQEYNADYDTGAPAAASRPQAPPPPAAATFEVDDDWGAGDDDDGGFSDTPNAFGCAPVADAPQPSGAAARAPPVVQTAVCRAPAAAGPAAKEKPAARFPMIPLDVVPEPSEDESAIGTELRDIRARYRDAIQASTGPAPAVAPGAVSSQPAAPSGGYATEEYEKYGSQAKRAFLKFTRRLQRCPMQVIRCAFGRVQHLSINGRAHRSVAPCPNCNASRRAEFQVLSTALNFLQPAAASALPVDRKAAKAIAFGTATVYTCSNNCYAGDGCYLQEEIIVDMEPDFAE
ncbi:putative 20S rRNA accumulation protein 4 [Diplonema papillatum]|nr:putative 20S rRNA accumulation protein 4 [Diplonema papillatum]|eukprot:gene3762-5860_t